MTSLEWNESLRVGVTRVDEQHRELFRLAAGLNDAMAEGRGKDVLGATIEGLIDYTVTHFSTEEEYFAAVDYPDAASHIAQHREFVAKVAEFNQGFAEDRLLLSLDVIDYIGSWLVDHIQVSDRAFGPYLNARGVN